VPIEVSWYVQGRVIYKRYYGVLTIGDLQASNALVAEYVASGKPLVHIIVNSQDVTKHPYSLKDINSTIPRTKSFHDGLGWTVMVSTHYIHRFMGQMASQMTRARFQTAVSLDEALQFLSSVDDSLGLGSPTT
jgi:hypothetical protein